MLVRLIYASRACKPIGHELIEEIIAASSRHNLANGITGMLGFSGDVFVQVLEGGREQVNRLFATLQHDPRHTGLTLLQYQEIDSRHYANWTMAKVRLDKVNLSLLLKYSTTPALDPFTVSGSATAALLEELAAAGACAARE
ncbi:BLUF domain-containing protein [Crenobacter sp. SG2303]|uniref:BLUF domain-containing protein n=1 Tax=Crenobacter oryzisoli TaxID=3056844 RepID=A0ABT7XN88_9NEIS|nr:MULTISPECIES: BLUF domain-containing protein [unclassified Crenobacter]MDN0075242.1 BLUF domain-containing protein [Crenobacter sp. SG2303]MDN0082832.1 BLUF domain-containing protein [Crenobacter sp. SG2305]